jgi:hypothetical protein
MQLRQDGHPRAGASITLFRARVIDEVAVIISDTLRFHAEERRSGAQAQLIADMAAGLRDWDRSSVGLADTASLFAGWVIDTACASHATYEEALNAADRAVSGTGEETLAGELLAFVEAYVSGAVADDELVRRVKAARTPGLSRQPRTESG